MAWRIDKYVVKGEIQNKEPDLVTGRLWLKGLNQPLELSLKGNCYRDLAGARIIFKNPNPIEGDYTGLDIFQDGIVGDMTASKKVKVPVNPEELSGEGDTPAYRVANCLYLEWFSDSNGRVLIESTDYKWRASLPKWNLSEHQESQQREANQQAMFDFMNQLSEMLDPDVHREPPEGEMNEFQWEAYLQKSDARSDMLLELFEKYEDAPNCEEIIAEAMGWEIESIEYEEIEEFDEWDEMEATADEAEDSYMPNHPLISAMMEITSKVYFETENRGLLGQDSNNPWNQLVWHCQMTVSKLIAALEEVAEDMEPEPGFVVATLKRALHLLHLTIATLEAAARLEAEKHTWCSDIRKELFSLRESMLDFMHIYRKQID